MDKLDELQDRMENFVIEHIVLRVMTNTLEKCTIRSKDDFESFQKLLQKNMNEEFDDRVGKALKKVTRMALQHFQKKIS